MPTPERTSTAAIVAAGRAIVAEHGPAALTMQAVAQRVGVRAPSLYKRVQDRDALLSSIAAAIVDDLGGRLQAAEGDLQALAGTYRSFAHEQPHAFRLIFTAAAPLDALEQASGPVLRTCEGLVGADEALNAARLFTAWATGFLQMELAGAFRLGGDIDAAFAYGLQRVSDGLRR